MSDPLFLLGKHEAVFAEVSSKVLRSVDAVRQVYSGCSHARWVASTSEVLALLAEVGHGHPRWHRLLLLERPTAPRRQLLQALFRVVVAPDEGVCLLPAEELASVMADERADDLFIGGVVDTDDRALVLYRGNLKSLVVPLRWFTTGLRGPLPDFAAFGISDFGQTVQFGPYEVAADAILYEFDAEARRRMKERAVKQDSSFGGSLRRLRLQRELSRSDFSPLNAKTIARIERGEVDEPQDETLSIIAKRLGVKPSEIKSY